MSTVMIDNIGYALDSLSEDAKAQFTSLQFVYKKLAQPEAPEAVVALYQTPSIGYSNALNTALPKDGDKDKH